MPPDIPFFLVVVAPNLGTNEKDCEALIDQIESVPVAAGAIAIDTTTQSLGGADENGAGMDMLMVNATRLAVHFQCLVILVTHKPVSEADRPRGKSSLTGGVDVSIISKSEKGSLVAELTIKKMRDGDDDQAFTVHLVKTVLGKTKKGNEVSTLVVESVEPGAAEGITQDKRKAVEILHDEFINAYDRLADGAQKSFGLDNRSNVLKVDVNKLRDELKRCGHLEVNEKSAITATGRTRFDRVKAALIKTKGGEFSPSSYGAVEASCFPLRFIWGSKDPPNIKK